MQCHRVPVRLVHSCTAREVSSVPLSLTIVAGRLRRALRTSSSRTTRWPPIDLSTTTAERLARAIVHDRQNPEPPARGEHVGDEVNG
jgi:hypothetical protein